LFTSRDALGTVSRSARQNVGRADFRPAPLPFGVGFSSRDVESVLDPAICGRLVANMADESLYDRIGGVFAIAAVVDRFSDAVVHDPIAGQASENPQLREWSIDELDRLPGLKFMRTLWLCDVAGGPLHYVATHPGESPLGLEEAHRRFEISPDQFDEVAAVLGHTLDSFNVPARDKQEVLAAFAAHKNEVTTGYVAAVK
jgi:hemoglobin